MLAVSTFAITTAANDATVLNPIIDFVNETIIVHINDTNIHFIQYAFRVAPQDNTNARLLEREKWNTTIVTAISNNTRGIEIDISRQIPSRPSTPGKGARIAFRIPGVENSRVGIEIPGRPANRTNEVNVGRPRGKDSEFGIDIGFDYYDTDTVKKNHTIITNASGVDVNIRFGLDVHDIIVRDGDPPLNTLTPFEQFCAAMLGFGELLE